MSPAVAPGDLLSRLPSRRSPRSRMIAELCAGAQAVDLTLRDRIRRARWHEGPLAELTPALIDLWESGAESLTFYVAGELSNGEVHFVKRLDDAMNVIDKFHRADRHAVPLIRKLLAFEHQEKEFSFARLVGELPARLDPGIEDMMRALAYLPDRFVDLHGEIDRELFEPRMIEPVLGRCQDLRIAVINITHECDHTSHLPYVVGLERAFRPLTKLEPGFIERTRPKVMNP